MWTIWESNHVTHFFSQKRVIDNPKRGDASERVHSGRGPQDKGSNNLKKELGLFDVYCISTGAMFSSGFFLLPGLATAGGGPSTVLAYLIAGCLMIPSMFGIIELSTALPRAGGPYYFMDRSLGPAMGMVTGLGSWMALVLKSAFALVGMGAYLAAAPGLAQYLTHGAAETQWLIKALAVVWTVVFAGLNIFGAKESTFLQKILVVGLLAILGFFVLQGFWYIYEWMSWEDLSAQYSPFLHERNGLHGLISTVGLVFISFAGLTHVTSVSEEVKRPERNLPLGMILSLATATAVYVLGVFILVAVLDPESLRGDLTPVATAADTISKWIPSAAGVILVTLAAIAAFASTGNAGILSASRYPLALARDKLMPARLGKLGRFHTPTHAILITGAATILLILALSTEALAKLGSSFNLLVFGLINLAVIVMRESRIESYDPGFRVPFYPFLPIAGVLVSGWLIVEMGWLTSLFSLGVVTLGLAWYFRYARPKISRFGAIHHVFERLGRYRHPELQTEFREIIKEKGLREEDPYDDIVGRAEVFDHAPGKSFEDIVNRAAESLAGRVAMDAGRIAEKLIETGRYGGAPISHGVALLHFRSPRVEHSEMVISRARENVCVFLPTDDPSQSSKTSCSVFGVLVLVSPDDKPAQHLRILAELAARVENRSFVDALRRIENPRKLKEVLLRDTRFLELFIGTERKNTPPLAGKQIREIDIPTGAFVAMVHRGEKIFEPVGETELKKGDRLTLIGKQAAIDRLYKRYVDPDQVD